MIGKARVQPIILEARDHCYEARFFTATETYIARVTRKKVYLILHGMTAKGDDLEVIWNDKFLILVLKRDGTTVAKADIDLNALTLAQLVGDSVHGNNVLKEVTA